MNTAKLKAAEWARPGEIKCWHCRDWISNNELENADGFCPHCDSEIDKSCPPYAAGINLETGGE